MRLLSVVAIPCAKVTVSGYPKLKTEGIELAECWQAGHISCFGRTGDFCGKALTVSGASPLSWSEHLAPSSLRQTGMPPGRW
jgi:hypothetical protein